MTSRSYRRLLVSIGSSSVLLAGSLAGGAGPEPTRLFPGGLQRGQTAQVTVQGNFPQWPVKTWADVPGLAVAPQEEKGKLTITASADLLPGVYLVRIYDDQGAASPIPLIVGVCSELAETEPNNDVKSAQSLAQSPVTINGQLAERGDVDVYSISATAGQTLVASVVANEKLGSPMDAIVQIVSPAGVVLAQNDEHYGLDPQLAWTVPSDGKYFVRIFAFPAAADASVSLSGGADYIYRLTVTTGPFIDRAVPLAVAEQSTQPVRAFGWNLTAAEPVMPVIAADRAVLLNPQWANSLSLSVVHGSILVPVPGAGEAKIELPASITSSIAQPNERHAYTFAAKQGQKLQARLESRTRGYPLDAVVELRDAAGKSLLRIDDNGPVLDPQLAFDIPADGDYRLEVSDLYGAASERHTYVLHVKMAERKFSIVPAAHAFVGKAGEELKIPVTVVRELGHDDEISFEVTGIPEGATLTPVTSKPAQGEEKLELVIKLPAAPFSGPIRIAGRTPSSDVLQSATVQVAGKSLADLWLTVTAAP